MRTRIEEIKRLIDEQLAIVPEHPLDEQYKSRVVANYCTALNALLSAERIENGRENDLQSNH